MFALMASAGISSGPAAFPFLSVMMAFLISAFVGLLQLMGSSVSAGGMAGGVSGAGRFSSSLKCSSHHFSCSSVIVSGFPSLSFTGLSVCWNLPNSFLLPFSLSGCFLYVTGQVFDVIPLVLPNAPLHFSVRCSIFYLCLYLGCSCSACVQVSFSSFSCL